MIYLKTEKDIEKIKEACEIWKKCKVFLLSKIKVGITTKELDQLAWEFITSNNAECTFFKYGEFPGNICVCVNDQLIHGVGDHYILKNGDLVTLDIGVTYKGMICDSAFSVIIGENDEAKKILFATEECLKEAISRCKNGNKIIDISTAIESTAKKYGYLPVTQYCGHGCGFYLHEDPRVPCVADEAENVMIKPGMVLCIEPMILTKTNKTFVDKKNKWTVTSRNHLLTCHLEHMVYVKENETIILTQD